MVSTSPRRRRPPKRFDEEEERSSNTATRGAEAMPSAAKRRATGAPVAAANGGSKSPNKRRKSEKEEEEDVDMDDVDIDQKDLEEGEEMNEDEDEDEDEDEEESDEESDWETEGEEEDNHDEEVITAKKIKGNRKIRAFKWEPVEELERKFPSELPKHSAAPLVAINARSPVRMVTTLPFAGSCQSISLNDQGDLIACASSFGRVRIWRIRNKAVAEGGVSFEVVQDMMDEEESEIEEFYNVKFTPNSRKLLASGKRKSRLIWDAEDDDNRCLPTHIKVFDVLSGKVSCVLEGHKEEILSIKIALFKRNYYVLSASEDGYIWKWRMSDNFEILISKHRIFDKSTFYTHCIAFVPETGNRFFVAGCDNGIKIFDFEKEQVLYTFPGLYSSFCDNVKFVQPFEIENDGEAEYYMLTRGVELVEEETQTPVRRNTCHLRMLQLPRQDGGKWRLETISTFADDDYPANTWMMKIASNGKYVLCPTTDGRVLVFNMRTAEKTAVLIDRPEGEVRDILFHHSRPLMFTCGEGGTVNVWSGEEASSHLQMNAAVGASRGKWQARGGMHPSAASNGQIALDSKGGRVARGRGRGRARGNAHG